MRPLSSTVILKTIWPLRVDTLSLILGLEEKSQPARSKLYPAPSPAFPLPDCMIERPSTVPAGFPSSPLRVDEPWLLPAAGCWLLPEVPPAPKRALGSTLGFSSALWTVSSAAFSAGLATGLLASLGTVLSFTASEVFSAPFIGLGTADFVSKELLDSLGVGLAAFVSGCATGTAASEISGAGSPGAGASVFGASLTAGGAVVWVLPLPSSVKPRLSSNPYCGIGGTGCLHTTIKKIATSTNTFMTAVMIMAFLLFSASSLFTSQASISN